MTAIETLVLHTLVTFFGDASSAHPSANFDLDEIKGCLKWRGHAIEYKDLRIALRSLAKARLVEYHESPVELCWVTRKGIKLFI